MANAAASLRAAGIEAPRAEALLLLGHALNATKAELLAHPERSVGRDDAERFEQLVDRRARREPYAYIVGRREFYGREFVVDRRVLVPRPETELLVEQALAVVAERRARDVGRPLVVDVGTGSGAIACSVALGAPELRVVGVDASAGALAVADVNRRRLGLADRVRLVRGSLLEWLGTPADLVVANLPYLPSARLATLGAEVARFEPRPALDGGPDGTDLIRRLVRQAPGRVRPGGTLLLELDPDQVEPIRRIIRDARTAVLEDLAGLPRVLRVDLP
jgi:release factor glutamine methyltransferase